MGRIVASVDCVPKMILSEEQTCIFNFHDFANLEVKRGERVTSPRAVCHGIEWSMDIYPFGDKDSKEGYVAIYLKAHLENKRDELRAKFEFGINNSQIRPLQGSETVKFSAGCGILRFGYDNYVNRSEVLDSTNGHLIHGTLRVLANIQVYLHKPVPWVPKKSLASDMMKMLESGESSDVTFTIEEKEYPLHLNVLKLRAPALAALAEGWLQSKEAIPLLDVDPEIFKLFLSFVYSDALPSDVDISNMAQKLLDVANKFGSSALKLLAESELVKMGVTVDNAADLLLYADAKHCALLRESTMDFICRNTTAVMETRGWDDIEQSLELMTEIMNKTRGNRKKKRNLSYNSNYDDMSVTTLRQKLDELGADVDGSREVLVNRLEFLKK